MKRTMLPLMLGMILLTSLPCATVIQAQDNDEQGSSLTVPWDEFRRLLNLDEDQIVLSIATFNKLVAQSGQSKVPPHAVQDGNVVLSRAAFRNLINQMRPPVQPGAEPPFNYLMTKAIYSGRMEKQNTAFTGTFHVHVLSEDVYLKVPILPQTIALENVTVDGNQALVVSEGGHHQVVLSTPGEHIVTAEFSLRSTLEQGPHKVDLTIRQTPITLLRLEIPLTGIDVEIPQAQQLIMSPSGEGTLVSGIIAPGQSISVRWREKVAVAERIPPKLYSEFHQLVSIEDDVLKVGSDIHFNILHSEIDKVTLAIPEGINVLSVQGEGVGEWQEVGEGDAQQIIVPFTYGRKGKVTIRVLSERPLSDDDGGTAFSGIRALGTVRETGFIGIEVKTSAEVNVTELEGLEAIVVQRLPQTLHGRAVKPLMHGFKYLRHPFNLVLAVHKHEKIAVPVATINSASAVTLFTEDGKIVHRLVYQVRNSAKQFLTIDLPEKADIWTVFVDNQPVESAINGDGKLLVPLIRSRSVNNSLGSFPVEVVYATVQDRFASVGSRHASLPPVDLLVSRLIWSVYLPNDFAYLGFTSTLEKEEMIRGLNALARAPRQYDERAMRELHLRGGRADVDAADELKDAYKGNEYNSRFRNTPLGKEEISNQLEAEIQFGGRLAGLALQEAPQTIVTGITSGAGVLPIEIQVPTGGQVYRFARTIIRAEDPLTMSVSYGASWMLSLLKWVALILILFVLFLMRRTVARGLRGIASKVSDLHGFSRKHEDTGRAIARSVFTPIILIGLLVLSWPVSRGLTTVVFFLFWISLVYQFALHRQRRAKARAPIGNGSSTAGSGSTT